MSVVRSVRLSSEMDELLQDEAKQRKISFNQLISSILNKYCEWDRFAQKLGFVSNSSILYRQLVDLVPEDRVEEFGVNSAKIVKEQLFLWYKKVDVRSLLQYMNLIFKYCWGPLVQYDQRVDEKNCVLSIHHVFGRKWSKGITYLMREVIKDILSIDPKIVTTENMIAVTFPMTVGA